MGDAKYNLAVQRLSEETRRIWKKESTDVEKLVKCRRGHLDFRFATTMMGEGELRVLAEEFWHLRETAKREGTDVRTLQVLGTILLTRKAGRVKAWFHMDNLSSLLEQAGQALKGDLSREEYITLIEELCLYVGRLAWWIELDIPWNDLSTFYESIIRK